MGPADPGLAPQVSEPEYSTRLRVAQVSKPAVSPTSKSAVWGYGLSKHIAGAIVENCTLWCLLCLFVAMK
jgi:hypothetical protein